jgi:hypothetical protein
MKGEYRLRMFEKSVLKKMFGSKVETERDGRVRVMEKIRNKN